MPGEPPERKKLLGLLTNWNRRKKVEIRSALVRHGERADSCWDSDWCFSTDAREYPLDPPLTENGLQQARETGQRLQRQSPDGGWNVVIASPYYRCVQTALQICVVTGADLLIDQSWGEVHSAEVADVFGADGEKRSYVRPYEEIARMAAAHQVQLRNPNKPCGCPVQRESTQEARIRYARKFLTYLERALLSRRSFIVVSHGEAFPGCCPLFPQLRESDVTDAPFCAFLLGSLRTGADAVNFSAFDGSDSPTVVPQPEQAEAVLANLSILDKTVVVRHRGAQEKTFRMPAWARSKKLKMRSMETLLEVLGLAQPRNAPFISASSDDTVTVAPPVVNLVELPKPLNEQVIRSVNSKEQHWAVGASTILLGNSFHSHSETFSLEAAKLEEFVDKDKKESKGLTPLTASPRGAKAHQGPPGKSLPGTARRGVSFRLPGQRPRESPNSCQSAPGVPGVEILEKPVERPPDCVTIPAMPFASEPRVDLLNWSSASTVLDLPHDEDSFVSGPPDVQVSSGFDAVVPGRAGAESFCSTRAEKPRRKGSSFYARYIGSLNTKVAPVDDIPTMTNNFTAPTGSNPVSPDACEQAVVVKNLVVDLKNMAVAKNGLFLRRKQKTMADALGS
jgi:broad specificity phosphatase PhoE